MSGQAPESRPNDNANTQPPPLWRVVLWPSIVLVLALGVWIWFAFGRSSSSLGPAPVPPGLYSGTGDARRDQFYFDEVEPILKKAKQLNLAAAERAVARINTTFDGYRRGVQPFVEDITGIGSRLRILWRMPGEWWYGDERIIAYVQGMFERHLFSEERIKTDLNKVLLDFREDLAANKNELLASYKLAVESSDLPDLKLPDYSQYDKKVRDILLRFSGDKARESVYSGLVTFVVSEVVSLAAEQIIVRVLVSVGTTAASSAAVAGGATAAGAAAGGGAGTLGGPVGTAIGIGVGLVVGIVVDWWMTDRFQAQLTNELDEYIEDLRAGLLEGAGDEPGFKDAAYRFAEDLSESQAAVMRQFFVGGAR